MLVALLLPILQRAGTSSDPDAAGVGQVKVGIESLSQDGAASLLIGGAPDVVRNDVEAQMTPEQLAGLVLDFVEGRGV